jgi:predicted dithiol-disulfide oxidoreductase (DUF899 family)
MADGIRPIWPAGASQGHIDARLELASAERELHDRVWQVAAARHKLPPGPVLPDYVLGEGPSDLGLEEPVISTPLSALFGEHDTLLIYHLMFAPEDEAACPMCSLWVDSLQGVAHHIAQHTAFVVVGKAQLPRLRAWALRRGWDGVRILTSYGTTFNADMNAETPTGGQVPMISVLRKDGGQIRHVVSQQANFTDGADGANDLLTPLWHVLDLLPSGRGDWYASNSYAGRTRA